MQSFHPCYVEVVLSYASDFMKQGLSCGLLSVTVDWTKCSGCCRRHLDACEEPSLDGRKSDGDLCSLNYTRNNPQLSTSSAMFHNFTPNFVYQRRKHRKNPVSVFTIQTSDPTEGPSLAAQGHVVTASSNGCLTGKIAGSEEASRILNVCNATDDCSSSKLNLELSSDSFKIDTNDRGECSSSGAVEEISERDVCISILRSQGVIDKRRTRQNRASTASTGVSSRHYCSKSCKICRHMDSTSNMLICDNCEDAFHVSCYNPHITILPVGEWLCTSCLKKKHKILKDKSTGNAVNFSTDKSEGELGSLEYMFRDTEPYMSSVRIGDEFQADVPDYCRRSNEECNVIGEALELDSSSSNNINNLQELNSLKPLKLSCIGNWLQCREVIEGIGEGVDGTICAKWRRAPLFEVQTDNWECFRCVLWDPAHADCAVPQELDTEEVMRQLKYIEMLRPRIAAKRRKLDVQKSSNGS